MDFINLKKRIKELFDKYKFVGIVLLMGIVLMMIPNKTAQSEMSEEIKVVMEEGAQNMETKMENILCYINGAGKVRVMLSIAKGGTSVYQTDSSYSQGDSNTDTKTQTILVTDSNRNETGLIYQKNPPVYQGAIVLAEGADDPKVKLAIVDAVMDVTGLGADRITVLKMQ